MKGVNIQRNPPPPLVMGPISHIYRFLYFLHFPIFHIFPLSYTPLLRFHLARGGDVFPFFITIFIQGWGYRTLPCPFSGERGGVRIFWRQTSFFWCGFFLGGGGGGKGLSDFSLDVFLFGSATRHAKSDFRLQTLYTILTQPMCAAQECPTQPVSVGSV